MRWTKRAMDSKLRLLQPGLRNRKMELPWTAPICFSKVIVLILVWLCSEGNDTSPDGFVNSRRPAHRQRVMAFRSRRTGDFLKSRDRQMESRYSVACPTDRRARQRLVRFLHDRTEIKPYPQRDHTGSRPQNNPSRTSGRHPDASQATRPWFSSKQLRLPQLPAPAPRLTVP